MTGRLLLAQTGAALAATLRARLEGAYFHVLDAPDAAADPSPAADLVLTEAGPAGLRLCRRLRAAGGPPAVLVAPREDRAARRAAFEAGAEDVVAPDAPAAALGARLRRLLRGQALLDALRLREETAAALGHPAPEPPAAGPARLLVLAEDPALGRRRAAQLAAALDAPAETAPPEAAEAAADAAARAADGRPWLALAELSAPPEAALRLLAALRARPALRAAGVLLTLPPEAEAAAFELGAADVVPHPPDLAELAARLRAEAARLARAEALRGALRDGLMLAARDPLTGLHNRRYAEPALARALARCRETARPLAVLVLDVDRFKAVNDRHGHAAGDAVLRGVARILAAESRGSDLLARIGGEEFCLALPGAGPAEAAAAAERLREALAAARHQTPAGLLRATASIGVAVWTPADGPSAAATDPAGPDGLAEAAAPPLRSPAPRTAAAPGAEVSALLAAADAALYASKAAGRNRVTLASAA